MKDDDTRLPGSGQPSWLVALVAVVAVLFVAYWTAKEWQGLVRLGLYRYDYAFFYDAFKTILAGHASHLYDVASQQQFLARWHFPSITYNQYVYPPQFAFVWAPFGLLPFAFSAALWLGLTLTAYLTGIFLLAGLLWPQRTRLQLTGILLGSLLLSPFQIDLLVGNVNSLLFAAVVLTFFFLERMKRPFWAGVPLGLAILFKVTPAAILLYLLLRRQWRVGASALVTMMAVTALALWWLGSDPFIVYAQRFYTFGQTSMKNGPAPYNQSLLGVEGMFAQHGLLIWSQALQNHVFVLYLTLVAAAVSWLVTKTPRAWRVDLAAASLMPLLFSPLLEEAHMVLALPALFVLAAEALSQPAYCSARPARLWSLLAVLCLLLLALPTTFAFNKLVGYWPQLFWLRTQMFWVLLLLLAGTMALAQRRTGYVRRQGPARPRDLPDQAAD